MKQISMDGVLADVRKDDRTRNVAMYIDCSGCVKMCVVEEESLRYSMQSRTYAEQLVVGMTNLTIVSLRD
jgi:hypothetical protein